MAGLGSLFGLGMDGLDPDMQKQMQQQMLMRAGLGMLAAGGQGARPGQALGQAGLGALNDMTQIGQVAYANKLRKQREEKQDKQWQQNYDLNKTNMEEDRAWRAQQADENARRWEFQRSNIEADNARADRALDIQANNQGRSGYHTSTLLYGPDGTPYENVFDARTGQSHVRPLSMPNGGLGQPTQPQSVQGGLGAPQQMPAQGQPGYGVVRLSPAAYNPALAADKAGATATGKAQAEARMQAPADIANAEQTLGLLDKALAHPGLDAAVGLSSWNPLNKVPGTDAANFRALQDQLQGKAFLQAYQSLRGGGHITEVEGTKAEDAIARLQSTQSEKEYRAALRELRDVVRSGIDRTKIKAGMSGETATMTQPRRLRYNPQTGQLE